MIFSYLVSLALFVTIVGLVLWSVLIKRDREWYEFLPTFFWQSLMAGSFLFQAYNFDPRYVPTQAWSIDIFSILIFASDWVKLPRVSWLRTKYSLNLLYFAYGTILFTIFLQSLHMYYMPEIPLVVKIMDKLQTLISHYQGVDGGSLPDSYFMELRESSSKLLEVPLPFIYLCQGALYVLAPFATMVLWGHRKWALSLAFVLFSLFYSRASLAKGTLYLFSLLMLIQIWFLLSDQLRKIFVKVMLGVGSLVFVIFSYIWFTHPSSIFIYKADEQVVAEHLAKMEKLGAPKILTHGDHSRLFRNEGAKRAFTEFEKFVNFLAYRIFFVPVEVSHFWYIFYPDVHGSYLGFYGLSPSTRGSPDFVHPANRLGLWAYRARFPQHYYESIRAYCSVDADAHSRWGFLGVFLIALALAGLRILWKLFQTEGRMGKALYASCLFVLGSALPAASFFAVFIANGVFLYFGLLLVLSLFHLKETV
ncbi:MAG: hypothetical protein KDD33_07360 [Bdellovibrionales bacterium]|nr:hypothetical protein [Bdellovibrionales bacterium]